MLVRPHRLRLLAPLALVIVSGCGARSALDDDRPPSAPPPGPDAHVDTGRPLPDDGGGFDGGVDPFDAGHDSGIVVFDAGADGGPTGGGSCVELRPGDPPVELSVAWREQAGAADIVVLFDGSGSMTFEIDGLRARFADTFRPAIERTSTDLRLAFASFQDFDWSGWFPAGPLPRPRTGDHHPFLLEVPLTANTMASQRALDDLSLRSTLDWPESQVESLYQLATGEGNGGWIPAGPVCPSEHFGYPCFRRFAAAVVLIFTDAPFHEGPGGRHPYPEDDLGRTIVPTHVYDETVAALNARNIRVAGFWNGNSTIGQFDLRSIAIDTGAVDRFGEPVFVDLNAPGTVPQNQITRAIQRLFDVDPTNVALELTDLDGDDGDALALVDSYETTEPNPENGARRFPDHYEDVWVGTRLEYVVTLRTDVAPGPRTLRYRLRMRMVGDDTLTLRSRVVTLVIPGADGGGC